MAYLFYYGVNLFNPFNFLLHLTDVIHRLQSYRSSLETLPLATFMFSLLLTFRSDILRCDKRWRNYSHLIDQASAGEGLKTR